MARSRSLASASSDSVAGAWVAKTTASNASACVPLRTSTCPLPRRTSCTGVLSRQSGRVAAMACT
jgi:hypothetical protein